MKRSDKPITRRQVISQIGGAVLGSALLPQVSAAQAGISERPKPANGKGPKQPNILWITTEGVPLKALSCYGSQLIHTPNIDRIANEGMRFENSFVTNALCAPSRATLMTGQYSHLHGMWGNPGGSSPGMEGHPTFDASQQTIGKILKQHGYQTGMVGKWHLPVNPGDIGFDFFVYKDGAGGPYYDPDGYRRNMALGSKTVVDKSYPGYITDNEIDFVIEGLEKFSQPFFMLYQPFSDHRPFEPPHKYEHIYDDVRIPEPGTFYDDYSLRSSAARDARLRIADMPDFNPPAELTERQRKQWNYQQFMRHFLGTLRAQDDAIGRLLNYLDQKGLAENTVVVYTGDHGFFLGDHGWFDKRMMYEQAIRVPWMVRYPGVVKAGSVSKDWVVNIDNAPTLLEIAGAQIPEKMQGRSLMSSFHGVRPSDWQTSMYYHNYEFGPPHFVLPFYGVRTERYKLISYYTTNEWELFDLEKDPDEMESLFGDSGYRVNPAYASVLPELVNELEQLRKKYEDDTGAPVKLWPASVYD
jgi:arylsulfatase A-like enzyme